MAEAYSGDQKSGGTEVGSAARPLRIAMISYYLPSGSKIGVGYQVDELARAMVANGHKVTVFSECPPSSDTPYSTRQIVLTGSLRTFRFAARLRDIDFSDYDVIHAHGDDYLLMKRRAAAHVRTLHGSNLSEALRIRGAKERVRMALLGLTEIVASLVADETVAVSPGTRRWTPWVRRVVPNGVDVQRFHPQDDARADHPVVLYVGTWGGRKRGAQLAEIFEREIRPRLPEAELWMVTQDAPSNVPGGIRVLGRVTDAELQQLYRQAWVFCLPSSYEGFGIPYIEAMASGTPVVATGNVGSRYILANGEGILTDLDGLGAALTGVLADPGKRAAMSTAGLVRAQDFALDSVVGQYEDLYREIIRKRRVPA